MNLLMAVPGKDYRIVRIRTKNKDQERFLANLGFIEGSCLYVYKNYNNGAKAW